MEIHDLESRIATLEEKEVSLSEQIEAAKTDEDLDNLGNGLLEVQSKLEKDVKRLNTLKQAEKAKAKKASLVAGLEASTSDKKEEEELKNKVSLGEAAYKVLVGGKPLDGAAKEMVEIAEAHDGQSYVADKVLAIPGDWIRADKAIIDQTNSALTPTAVSDQYVRAIRETAIYPSVGATVYENLAGEDFKIPVAGKITAAHASAENADASDGGAQFDNPTLQADRITTYADLSNKITLQNGDAAMSAVMFEIGAAVGETINDAMFPTTTLTNAPTSIAATSGVGTFTESLYAAPSNTTAGSISSDMVAALVELTKADALQGNLAYVASPEVMQDLINAPGIPAVTTALETGRPGNMGQTFRGYPIYFTNSCTSSAGVSGDFIFGNFRKVHVGFFGSLVIQRDAFTQNLKNVTRLVAHRYYDFKLVQGAAFVKATSLSA